MPKEEYKPKVGDYILLSELDTEEKHNFARSKMTLVHIDDHASGCYKDRHEFCCLGIYKHGCCLGNFNSWGSPFLRGEDSNKVTLKDLGWLDDSDESGKRLSTRVKPRKPEIGGWSNTHYDFIYKHPVTRGDSDVGYVEIKVDPYFVNKQWGLGSKDNTGILFHNLKTIARFGGKNEVGREIKALYNQTKRMAELYDADLGG